MSFYDTQNPGIGGLKELTAAETLVVQEIAALGLPGADRLIGWDNTDLNYAYFVLGSGLTYTHSTHTLSVSSSSGATAALDNLAAVAINASLLPGTDGAINLGSVTKEWGNLYIATGGTFNFANGNVILTHSSGILTMGTGDLRITTAGTNAASVVTVGGTQTLTNKTLTAAVLGSSTATTQSPNDNSTKVATTAYVDAAVLNFDSKPQVAYVSTSALPANTYNNGTSGVGATLTGNANGALVIDGVTILVGQVGERVLVAGESTSANNGWYTITQQGVAAVSPYILTRAVESDQAAEIGSGYLTSVIAPNGVTPGTNNGKAYLSVAAANPFVVGTTNLTFTQVGGTYTNGNGLSLSGSTFSINTAVTVDLSTSQALTNKTISGLTVSTTTGTFTLSNSKTLTVSDSITLATNAITLGGGEVITFSASNALSLLTTGTTVMTFPQATDTVAVLGTAQTFTATNTHKQVVFTNNAITATSNAATVPITSRLNTVTNNSAATLTITMTTTSAVDGQLCIVRILDSSAAAQTITWVNTENSTVTAPTTSNGSTTLFLTVGFIYNSGTTKWRCIASS